MKKTTFYICETKGNKVMAAKRTGYAEGDIGLHAVGCSWLATHIPTGTSLGSANTRKQALEDAKTRLFSAPNIEQLIQAFKRSKEYIAFEKSMREQIAAEK